MIRQSDPLFVDSDNAMGSPFGDVDDGFAVAALLKSGYAIHSLSSTFGNTFEPFAYKNHVKLAETLGAQVNILRGAPTWWTRDSAASQGLAQISTKTRVLALGPMTNIALALKKKPPIAQKISELVFVGTNFLVPLPAWRFFDFNQWKDPKALRTIFDSSIPLTCVPCNVARRLRATWSDLESLPGTLGSFLRKNARRWFVRARLTKGQKSIPIWDLTAALYVLCPQLFDTLDTQATLCPGGQVIYGKGEKRSIRVVIDFDPTVLWKKFVELCER